MVSEKNNAGAGGRALSRRRKTGVRILHAETIFIVFPKSLV